MTMIRHLAIAPKQKRIRNKEYLDHVRSLPCCIGHYCDGMTEPHHLLRGTNQRGAAYKPGDNHVIPLCEKHHRGQNSLHWGGNEKRFLDHHGIDGPALAKKLYAEFLEVAK